MNYQDAAEILNRNSGVFDITTPYGKERKRLFLSAQGNICEFAKRSKTRGYPIAIDIIEGWSGMVKVERSETDIVAKFKRYASRATFPRHLYANALKPTRQRAATKTTLPQAQGLTER